MHEQHISASLPSVCARSCSTPVQVQHAMLLFKQAIALCSHTCIFGSPRSVKYIFKVQCCICRWVSRGLNSDHAGISNTVCTTALHHCSQKSIVLAACACLLWVLAFVHCGCKQKGTLSGRVSFGCHVYQKVLNGVVIDVQGGSFQEGPMPFGNVPTHQYQPPTGLPSRRKALICGCNYRSPTSPICSFFSNNN